MSITRREGESVGFRLFLGVSLTLLAAGFCAYALFAASLREHQRERGGDVLRAAVQRFEAHGRSYAPATRKQLVAALDRRRREEAAHTEDFLIDLRGTLLLALLPALAGAVGLFWLLAGRTVHLRHRTAVERASRDALTDLGDHRAFSEELRRASGLADRSDLEYALALFDIDDFKFLNDRRGHQHGDDILRRVAEVLQSGRAQDRPFRIGGDEFALIMPATSERDGAIAAGRLRRQIAESGVAVSCGVSGSRPLMRGWSTLREEADAAVYEAKRRHAEAPVCFSDFADRAFIVTTEKAHQVRLLIQDRAMDVALQPIWDLDGGGLIGFEGLARPHSDYELAGPAEAFDVAEQIGRIGDLDRLCMTRILERAGSVPEGVLLFINIHPANLDDDRGGPRWLLDAARAASVDPGRIVIEVTERSGARLGAVVRAIDQLRRAGFKVALDDVGAGNSGLEMLNATHVDFVKVDRTIVARAAEDVNARAVLAAISAFAKETGCYVIAEGIEDRDHLEFVRALEVSVVGAIRGGQGYGLGRPAPTVADALAGRRPAMCADEPVEEPGYSAAAMPTVPSTGAPIAPWRMRSAHA
jgi:diguanylate cyclase (GGDEF)-like protein